MLVYVPAGTLLLWSVLYCTGTTPGPPRRSAGAQGDKTGGRRRTFLGRGVLVGAGGGGWDRYNTKGERIGKCGDSKPGEGKPK